MRFLMKRLQHHDRTRIDRPYLTSEEQNRILGSNT